MEPVTDSVAIEGFELSRSKHDDRLTYVKVRLEDGHHFYVRPDNLPPLDATIEVTYSVRTDDPLPFEAKQPDLDAMRAAVEDFGRVTS
jgi:hypothetical protein